MQHIIWTKSIYKSEYIKIKKTFCLLIFDLIVTVVRSMRSFKCLIRKERKRGEKKKRKRERERERVSLSLSLFLIFEIYISGSGKILGDALCVFKCIPFCHSSVTFVHIIIIIIISLLLMMWVLSSLMLFLAVEFVLKQKRFARHWILIHFWI